MDISRLQKIADYQWTLPQQMNEQRSPIHLYGSEELLVSMDDKVLEQITNVAKLPGLVGAAMAMPDAHWGYGFPIGGVAAFDADAGGVISAGGVGFDISCGIRCLRTNLIFAEMLSQLQSIADALYAHIPAGLGKGGRLSLSIAELDEVMVKGVKWAIAKGYGNKADLKFIEEQGTMSGAEPEYVSELAKKRQQREMGTLGSGNHYLEVQRIDKIYDAEAADAYQLQVDQIIISIHCGSRGLGHQIGSDYLINFAKLDNRLGLPLPERELAYAPLNSDEGQQYLGAMRAAINCALANRQILAHLTSQVFADLLPQSQLTTFYDVSHNTCKYEKHFVAASGKEQWLYVHRKGATRALGPQHPLLPAEYATVGQPVIIGGSMGTGSYILAGNPVTQNQAFASASHGAGRAVSRHQALKQWRGRELIDSLKSQGIIILSDSVRGIAEEAPGAYKDVDLVAKATEGAGLARRVAFLRPIICIKG